MDWVLWITGLPGSGKSTLAFALKKRWSDVIILNMDHFRTIMTPKPTYSDTERHYVYRAIICTAKILYDNGHKVIIDATANKRQWRELAKEVINNFYEVYLNCPLSICMEREAQRQDAHGAPQEIYHKGRHGAPVPGLSIVYEEPLSPDLIIDSASLSKEKALQIIIDFIAKKERH